MKRLEHFTESLMYSARWLLAPLYLGLSLILMAVVFKFFQDVYHLFVRLPAMADKELILAILGLIDLVLVSGLALMVMLSGYESFVSRIDVAKDDDELSWLGKMDADVLKTKLSMSIVAISSIELLRVFMNAGNLANDKIYIYMMLHIIFVLSAVGMSIQGRLSSKSKCLTCPGNKAQVNPDDQSSDKGE